MVRRVLMVAWLIGVPAAAHAQHGQSSDGGRGPAAVKKHADAPAPTSAATDAKRGGIQVDVTKVSPRPTTRYSDRAQLVAAMERIREKLGSLEITPGMRGRNGTRPSSTQRVRLEWRSSVVWPAELTAGATDGSADTAREAHVELAWTDSTRSGN